MPCAVLITNTEVALIIISFLSSIILWVAKTYFHYQYLKEEEGYFKNADSYLSLLSPFSAFKYFPEFFIITYVPILWDLKRSSQRYIVGVLTYLSLLTFIFAITICYSAGR